MLSFREALHRAREYDEIAHVSEIARRYFAMNAFDGVVTIIGVLSGAMVARVKDPAVVLVTGFATAFAMGVSGFMGAYLTESAERQRSMRELERHTLSDLDDTQVGRANRFAVVAVTIVDGLSPVMSAGLVLLPFAAARWMPSIQWAYGSSLGLSLVVLFSLGAFLGRISRGHMLVYGLKTTIAGIVAIVVSLLLGVVA